MEDPIYICGCGHSGTTIMYRILSEHSQIYPAPNEMFKYNDDNSDEKIKEIENELNQQCLENNCRKWLLKEPLNLLHINRILKLHPKAKIIIMIRDGRDVALSFKERGHIKSFTDCIKRWKLRVRQMEPFRNTSGIKIVKLEDLITRQDKAIREILQFLEVDQEYLLNYHKTSKSIYTMEEIKGKLVKPKDGTGKNNHLQLRNWECNQPLMNTSKWKKIMTLKERKIFAKLANRLIKWKYEKNSTWIN